MHIEVNGIGLEVRVDGPEDGPPVLLLHGWPDRANLWDHQITALNGAGFRTIAPDLRGFGDSDKPVGVEHYNLLALLGDVLGVLDHLGVERVRLVGHDWGSALAWAMTGFAAPRVEKLVAMSVGHPSLFAAAGLEQRRRSWYMLLFQFDGIAEQWLSNDDWKNMRDFVAGHRGVDDVIADASRPGALTAGLSWYRANVPPESIVAPALEFPPVTVPTMGIWSSGDVYLVESPMSDAGVMVAAPYRYERIDGASHWMQLDATDEVNRLLLDFLP